MNYFTFGVIVLGSKDISLKIYEISLKNGIRQLDHVNCPMEIGREGYVEKKISLGQIEEICVILNGFSRKLKEYQVKQTRCYATSAIREAKNKEMVANHIKVRTGFTLIIPSNSELRLLMYKGMTRKQENFNQIIEKNTAILDVGAGSVQISLFNKGELYMTQNIPIRTLNIQNLLSKIEGRDLDYAAVVEEYVSYELSVFQSIYLKDKAIKNLIIIGQDNNVWNKIAPELQIGDHVTMDNLEYLYKKIRKATTRQIAAQYDIPFETARFTLPSILIYKIFLEQAKADHIWISQTDLCDGVVVDFAEQEKKIILVHDFNQDIIATARNLAKKYRCNKMHTELVEEISLTIFDRMRKYHGLGTRERILLQIACILHDCGKFINMNETGINSYHLIRSTEIIGLSHRERKMIAYIVLHHCDPTQDLYDIPVEDYLIVVKLSAILRVANTLDRDSRQKFVNYTIAKKKNELLITVVTDESITLEKVLFQTAADSFEEVYGIRPVIIQRSEQING